MSNRVSGNVVVVCLTVIILGALGLLAGLALSGRDAPTTVAGLLALLGAAVPAVMNSLGIHEVKQQTNGNTTQLLGIVEQLTTPAETSTPGGGSGEVTGPAPPPRHRAGEQPR